MNINLMRKRIHLLMSYAIKFKKIFLIWFSIYILGLILIFLYKMNNYEFSYEIGIFKQYLPIETHYHSGIDPLIYKLIKNDLNDYQIVQLDDDSKNMFIELKITLIKKTKEEIRDEINLIKEQLDNFKNEVVKLALLNQEELETKIKYFNKYNESDRILFFNYYLTHSSYFKLFINEYSEKFIIDNYNYESIDNIKINLILKIFHIYILFAYLINLCFWFYKKNI